MSIDGESKRALLDVSEKAKDKRTSNEKNYRLVSRGDQFPFKIFKEIIEMSKKVQNIQVEYVEIKRESVRYQRLIKRLDKEIQKQTTRTEELKRQKNDIVKNEKSLSKEEREDELNVHLDEKKRLITTIVEQNKKIKQLIAEKKDKFKFFHQQVYPISNRNQGYEKNKQLTKKNKYEKEEERYKGLCKTKLLQNILAIQTISKMIYKLKREEQSLKQKFQRSAKDLNKTLYKADHCKSEILLQFDSHYDQDNKDELLKLTASIFNMLITTGFTNYWGVKAEMTKRKMELWPKKEQSGKPVTFHSPFSPIVISFPNDVLFDDCYEFKRSRDNSTMTTIITNYNITKKNDGFMSLQLE